MSTVRYPAAAWGARLNSTRAWAALGSPAVAWTALAALLLATGAFLLHETRGITLWFDEWTWVLHRRGGSLGTYLDTHNGHLSLVPVAIFKLLYATVGIRSYLPYRLLVIAGHLGCCLLLFVYARRRVGSLGALMATLLLLLFGPGWENLMWPFQISWLLSLGGGVGALLALDRHDRVGDILACLLVALALASSSIGIPLAIGVALDLALTRRHLRHAWIVAAPLALYAVWWIAYQHTTFVRHDIVLIPGFAASGIASTFAALAGLAGPTALDGPGTLLTYGPPLAVAAIAAAGWRVRRVGQVGPRVAALTAALVSFWVIGGFTRAFLGLSYSSRYLYVSALLVLLLALELMRGVSLNRWVAILVAALALAAATSNFGLIRDTASMLRGYAETTRADLAALEIGRPLEGPAYVAQGIPGYPFVIVRAGEYFAAAHALGSPAATQGQLAAYGEAARETADGELIRIHRLALQPASAGEAHGAPPTLDKATDGSARVAGACVAFRPSPFGTATSPPTLDVTVPSGGLLVESSSGSATVAVRRFGNRFQSLGMLVAAQPAGLTITADRSSAPWHLQLAGATRLFTCGI